MLPHSISININRLDRTWSSLPHEPKYHRYDDARYWEYRIAILTGGYVIGTREHSPSTYYERKGDVISNGIIFEVKKSRIRQKTTNAKRFNFSNIRGRNKYHDKMADIAILIGICDCEDGLHFWSADYRELAYTVTISNYAVVPCPKLPYFGNGNNRALSVIKLTSELEIFEKYHPPFQKAQPYSLAG